MRGKEPADPLVSLFLDLARIASPSGHEREIMDHLTARLRGVGLEVEESEPIEEHPAAAGNLYCRLAANAAGKAVMFAAHVDTVASAEDALPSPVLENGIISSGSRAVLGADDKAAVAAMVLTLEQVIKEQLSHAGIELLLTVGEESGLRGAKSAPPTQLTASCGFCMDSTGPVGRIVASSPSQKTIRATFIGKPAHAGVAPEQGRSAIVAAAKAVAEMKLGRINADTTANIGIIRGGEAVNVVPGRCHIAGEARSHVDEKLERQVTSMLEAVSYAAAAGGVDVEVAVVDEFQGFNIGPGHLAYDLALQAFADIDIRPEPVSTGGGSDVNVFNLKGVPSVNLSAGMEQVHTPDEYISVESLHQCHQLLLAIIRKAVRG